MASEVDDPRPYEGLLPAWGKLERMGHVVDYGYFESMGQGTARCMSPAVAASGGKLALPAKVALPPLGGPAFYGFTVLTEAEVRRARARARLWEADVEIGDHEPEEGGE